MTDEQAQLTPQQVFAMMSGYIVSGAIKAALELEVFTHIANGNDTAEKIAAAKKTTPRAMRILCDVLVAQGLLGKSSGRYSVPPTSRALLVKGSPGYIGAMSGIAINRWGWDAAGRMAEVLKAGHSLVEQGAEAPQNPFWEDFARGSRQMAIMSGPAVADVAASVFDGKAPARILDIAAGSGYYGFSALKKFPNARLTSMDWPNVLALAEPTVHQLGLKDRVEFRPGDIFNDDLGSGYDLILAVNIYHHFSIEKNTDLSKRLAAALATGGALIIVDMVPDEAREQDRFALMFAMTMMLWTQEGDTFTKSEYEKMLKPAGFTKFELREMPGMGQKAIIAKR
jgi:SAM-dependent methyltransferase